MALHFLPSSLSPFWCKQVTRDSVAAGVRLAEVCASALPISLSAGRGFYYPITLPPTSQTLFFCFFENFGSPYELNGTALALASLGGARLAALKWKLKAAASFLRRHWSCWQLGANFPLPPLCVKAWFHTGWNAVEMQYQVSTLRNRHAEVNLVFTTA